MGFVIGTTFSIFGCIYYIIKMLLHFGEVEEFNIRVQKNKEYIETIQCLVCDISIEKTIKEDIRNMKMHHNYSRKYILNQINSIRSLSWFKNIDYMHEKTLELILLGQCGKIGLSNSVDGIYPSEISCVNGLCDDDIKQTQDGFIEWLSKNIGINIIKIKDMFGTEKYAVKL